MKLPLIFSLSAAVLLASLPVSAQSGGVINIQQATSNLGVGLVNEVGEAQLGDTYKVYVDEPRKLARHGIEARRGERLDLSIDMRASGGDPFLTLEGGSLSGPTRLEVDADGSIGGTLPAVLPGMSRTTDDRPGPGSMQNDMPAMEPSSPSMDPGKIEMPEPKGPQL